MGILDQVIGAALGGRAGGRGGIGGGGGSGSPLMMALMALLASRAGRSGGMGGLGGALGGGLGSGGGLGGGLGGALAGAGGLGGLGALVEQFTRAGHGETVNSWVGHGQNRQIAPNQLADALGADTIDDLTRQTGMDRENLLSELSGTLPDVVDRLTPEGRLPNDDEMSRW